jgi:heterodisulfide reductase subunit A
MAHILVIGGGISGCTAAQELARRGQQVTILEKSERIGGKAREFGCKASDVCNNCGVCLAGGLWEDVESHSGISVLTSANIVDVAGCKGDFTAVYDSPKGRKTLNGISAIVVAAGFERACARSFASLEFNSSDGIISGFELEKLIAGRTKNIILPNKCTSVAFLQCIGSRDIQGKALYCSRVCCAYATRAAKVLKYVYPGIQITFFHMDLQYIRQGSYYEEMNKAGIEFIRCKPVMIPRGAPLRWSMKTRTTEMCVSGSLTSSYCQKAYALLKTRKSSRSFACWASTKTGSPLRP